MRLLTTIRLKFASIFFFLSISACGGDSKAPQSLQERFEAVYGYTDCKNATIGTAFTDSLWTTIFHTYHNGFFEQIETSFVDEECKTSLTGVQRFASYEILPSSDETAGQLRLAVTTRRILSSTNENVKPGMPVLSCDREQAADAKKEECEAYRDVTRYVTVKLTDEGYQPFKDLDSAGTTEDTASTELAPHILKTLNGLDD